MDLRSAEYFYTNYVGHHPLDEKQHAQTQDMIGHYVDAGLESFLPDIYEHCAKDGVVNTTNIPKALWAEGNLMGDAFYMHPALSLMSPAPAYDPFTGEVETYRYYRENVERFTLDDILRYADGMLKRPPMLVNGKEDKGAVKYLLGKYAVLRQKKIEPLDMVMFLILHHRGESVRLIDIAEGDEEVLAMLLQYQVRLIGMGRYKVTWRGRLNE